MYQQIHTVCTDDLDDLMHVNNIRYVEWVQNVAKAHWNDKATQVMRETYYWVMLSHFIEYKSQAFLNDELTIKTYVESSNGATSTRIVEIINNLDKKLIAKSVTKWCLIDTKTKRPARITKEIAELFN